MPLMRTPSAPTSIDGVEQSKYFCAHDNAQYIPAFTLKFRNGGFLSLPYALHPIVHYNPKQGIVITLDDKDILITGRKLQRLAGWISKQKVLWIKESNTGRGLEADDIFIENIIVKEKS